MLRCASPFVIAAYITVRLIPQASRALPAKLFTKPSQIEGLSFFFKKPRGMRETRQMGVFQQPVIVSAA
jgi:hypothetical protein